MTEKVIDKDINHQLNQAGCTIYFINTVYILFARVCSSFTVFVFQYSIDYMSIMCLHVLLLFGNGPNPDSPILSYIFFDFSLTVKAEPHECVIRTGQP